MITLYRLADVNNVAIWNLNQTFPLVYADGAANFAAYNGLPVKRYYLPTYPVQADYDNMVARMKADGVETIIGAANPPDCALMTTAIRHHNFMPKAFFQTYCAGEPGAYMNTPDAMYGVDMAEYDPRMIGPDWTDDLWYPPANSSTSPQLVFEDLFTAFNETPQWSVPIVMSGGLVLHKVLQERGTLDPKVIRSAISAFNSPTFVGTIAYSPWGQNSVKDVILLQADTNFVLQIVYPLGAATKNFAFPAPTFDERVFNSQYMHTTLEAILAIIVGVLIFISVLLMLFVFFYHNHQHVRAASPVFLTTILAGSIMLYSVFYTWTLIATTAVCHLRIWLLGVGFVLMFGALFAKTWRVMRIFTLSDIRVFKITNLQLMAKISILLGIEIALLIAWSAASRPHQVLKVIDPIRPSKNLLVCSTSALGTVFLSLLVAYKLIMVGFGIYMSIRIWKIPRKEFNESRSIAFSMYNMLTFGVITFALQVSQVIPDPAMFIIRTICISLSTIFTIGAIFGPKLRVVITGHTGFSTSTQTSMDSFTKPTSRGTASRGYRLGTGHGESSRDSSIRERYHSNNDANNNNNNNSGHESLARQGKNINTRRSHAPDAQPTTEELQKQLQTLSAKYEKLRQRYLALKQGAQSATHQESGDSSSASTSSTTASTQ